MASDPGRRPHGRNVQDPDGYTAFVPALLAPPIAWDAELVAALSDADQAIGRLAGEGSYRSGFRRWVHRCLHCACRRRPAVRPNIRF